MPDLIRDIRVLGAMIGLDLTFDAAEVVSECLNRRLLINATHGHVVRLLPALTSPTTRSTRAAPSWRTCSGSSGRLEDRREPVIAWLRHFVDLFGFAADDARALLDRARELKRENSDGLRPPFLLGRTLGLIFEKPSLRTRVSFEAAIARLGGNSIFLRDKDVGMGVRESIADFARVISQYVDALPVRTFSHAIVEELASHATVPIINALSDARTPARRWPTCSRSRSRGEAGRDEARLRGRRQQRRPIAGAGRGPPRDSISSWPRRRATSFPPIPAAFGPGSPSVPLMVEHDPRKAVEGPTSSIPTSGPAWVRNTRPIIAGRCSSPSRLTKTLMRTRPARRRSSSTACPPTGARK